MKLYHKYVHTPQIRGDDLWYNHLKPTPPTTPTPGNKDKIARQGLSLAWAMLSFILKTFYREKFQNMQQWKEYFNELSPSHNCFIDYQLVAHPFIHTPPVLPTPTLGLSWSKPQRDILSGILTHGQSQMGYRSADISTSGSSWVGPGVMGNTVWWVTLCDG